MIGAKEYARVRIVDRPTRRLESMIGLREELLDLSEELQVKLKGILEKYIEERYDQTTDEGLLRQDIQKFNDCYKIDIEKVETLLNKEVQMYMDDLEYAEKQAKELVKKMHEFFRKNNDVLSKFLDTSEGRVDVLAQGRVKRDKVQKELMEDGKYDKHIANYLEGEHDMEKAMKGVFGIAS